MTPQFINGTPEERIKAMLSIHAPNDVRFLSQFMADQVKLAKFTRTSPTTCVATYAFKVERFYSNFSNNLHGGAQATIYDILTSITLQSIGTPDFWGNAGVSR